MFQQPLQLLDITLAGSAIGATVWFFFIQSPALIKFMGRDKFVPVQMRLTKVLFATLSVVTLIVVGLSVLLVGFSYGSVLDGAVLAAVAALACHFYVVPRALRAGGKGRMETSEAGGDNSVGKFAVEGSGPSAKFWHQTLVVFVVVLLVGLVVHLDGVLGV